MKSEAGLIRGGGGHQTFVPRSESISGAFIETKPTCWRPSNILTYKSVIFYKYSVPAYLGESFDCQ